MISMCVDGPVVACLVDHDFEVETTRNIGGDPRMVEHVTGKPTRWPRALLSGVAGGAWFVGSGSAGGIRA